MQFYIINSDPFENACSLPDYALKRVNVREGWQILCDCFRAIGIEFDGQAKEYNRYHPNTSRFWESMETFSDFIAHYSACLGEYGYRFGDTKMYQTYQSKFTLAVNAIHENIISEDLFPGTKEKQTLLYLLERKSDKLVQGDEEKLRRVLYECDTRDDLCNASCGCENENESRYI